MPEFFPELIEFYSRPFATVKEINQAKIRGAMMADAVPKNRKSRIRENVALAVTVAIASLPLAAYLLS